MSNIDNLATKLENMPLDSLLHLSASAIESNMDEKRLNFIFMILETRLQKRRIESMLRGK